MPENASFQGYFAEVFFDTSKETSSHISIMAIFSKFFGAFMRHIIRWNAGQKIELFFELSINKIFWLIFVSIMVQ